MKPPEEKKIEVDMVPLIDIISLLLMFLVMTGNMAKSTSSVKLTLPRESEAKNDKTLDTKGRIVVQMRKDKDGKYWAVVENNQYELVSGGGNKTLVQYLEQQIKQREMAGVFKPGPMGEVTFPVKLRIDKDAPMREAERLIMTLAQAKLVNVHYATEQLKAGEK